ncbi:MAG: ACP S-malonyltransferase [Alphaproteobacteria bacterium]|nr:ACP S-malonyltransferase [Alphaproteobacteria bacterium]
MTTAFVFPGQGAQAVGMGKGLADAFASAGRLFEEVDEALGQNLSGIMFDGPEEQLTLTENAQPALMAASMAVMRVLAAEGGVNIGAAASHVAGHSLGEYSALAAAGAIEVADAARLLKTRGQAMQKAVPVGGGAMAAVLGLDLETVEAVAAEAGGAAGKEGICAVANDNAPGQVVLSGDTAAIDRAIEIAKNKGAKRSIKLAVSAPFHCALMAPAAEVMDDALGAVSLVPPKVPLIANVTAAPATDPDDIKALLVQQITGRVRWRESMLAMVQAGVIKTVEVGPGKILSGLNRRIADTMEVVNIGGPSDVETYLSGE